MAQKMYSLESIDNSEASQSCDACGKTPKTLFRYDDSDNLFCSEECWRDYNDVDSVIERFKTTGRVAFRYPRKGTISLSGKRAIPEDEAIAEMQDIMRNR